MDSIGRLAIGLARSPTPEHRWRRVAVPVVTAIAGVLILAAASLVMMERREAGRGRARTALVATTPAPTDVLMLERTDDWRGQQYAVIWLEPAGRGDSVLPPGMARLPAPGQAVVSPALDRLARRESGVAARYPDRLVLGEAGIRTGDELLAYLRTPVGRTIGNSFGVQRVRAFGPSGDGGPIFAFGIPAVMNAAYVVQGVLAFLVLPGLLVLAVGSAAASPVRDHRFGVLGALGAPRRARVALAVLETEFLASVGLAAAVVVWGVVSPRLSLVPLVGREVVRGDLGVPVGLLGLLFGVMVVAIGVTAALVTAVGERGRQVRSRPTVERVAFSPMRLVPLLVAIALLILGTKFLQSQGPKLLLGGFLVSLVSVPLLFAWAVRMIGAELSEIGSVSALLAGRAVQWDPVRITRPFATYGMLVIIAVAGSGVVAVLRYVDNPELPVDRPAAVVVDWVDPDSGDVARLAGSLGTSTVVPIRNDGSSLLIGATCTQLAAVMPELTCRADADDDLPPETAGRLALLAVSPGLTARLVQPDTLSVDGNALVLDNVPLGVLDESVRGAALRTLPVPNVVSWKIFLKRESPRNAWMVGGMVIALISLTMGSMIAIVDRLLATRRYRRLLLNLGLVPRQLLSLELWLFTAPFAAVFAVSFTAGLALCTILVRLQGLALPWQDIGWTIGLSFVVGCIGAASVAVFGVREVNDNALPMSRAPSGSSDHR